MFPNHCSQISHRHAPTYPNTRLCNSLSGKGCGGNHIAFSIAKRKAQGHSTGRLYRKIILRTVVLFVLGMVAQGNLLDFDRSTLHIFCNTLQAIAVGYLLGAILLIHLPTIGLFSGNSRTAPPTPGSFAAWASRQPPC